MTMPFFPNRNEMTQRGSLNRRDWMRLCAAGASGLSMSGWFGAFADEAARRPDRRRSCILLWMSGGPSQIDTFDLKPGHANGGTFQEIETAVLGMKFSQHLPRLRASQIIWPLFVR